jgi:hypothetical protein
MIRNVVSSAARLPLAPAKLTGRMAGSLLRQVRGNGAGEPESEKSTAATKPASRSRQKTRQSRAASRTGTKAQTKRTARRSRAKAGAKRTASGGAKARPQRRGRPQLVDDAASAQSVESNISSDLDTDQHDTEPAGTGDPKRGESSEPVSTRQEEPDTADLDKDPAYQPSDPSLRGIKGG